MQEVQGRNIVKSQIPFTSQDSFTHNNSFNSLYVKYYRYILLDLT